MTPDQDLLTRAERARQSFVAWSEDGEQGYCHLIEIAHELDDSVVELVATLRSSQETKQVVEQIAQFIQDKGEAPGWAWAESIRQTFGPDAADPARTASQPPVDEGPVFDDGTVY